MKNARFTKTSHLHGWHIGWEPGYEEIVVIECECGHLSVQDLADVKDHVCPHCGRQGS